MRSHSLEERVSAYIDGELPDDESAEVSRLIVSDGEAKRIYQRLQIGNEVGNSAFAALLKEPLQLSFVRKIRPKQRPGWGLWGID